MERVIELIRSAGDGAFAIDRLQRIVFWNDACREIFGYTADEVLGKPCYDIIGGTADDGCAVCRPDCPAMKARAEQQAIRPRHMSVHHKDGSERWTSVSTLQVPSSWSELSVLVHLVRDISTHKHIEALVGELTGDVARLKAGAPSQDNSAGIEMTRREREILQAMSTGKTSPEIAEHLNISRATVRNHIHNILSKLGVRNRLEAVILSLRAGLL
ncbi:MAG: PAS domain S-box protein [Gammaproteobacteria bacterium]|nr:PAS domain S-box protein [Gammaproteobacteria bacterium]NNF61151.1 PAS domain S-box protein [Gammaproteobacteria bacterium]NNM19759.1 PAS domain S-box protein [Gammaproteobacteria bacterium]